MKTATTRVAATSFPRIAVAAGLVPAIIYKFPTNSCSCRACPCHNHSYA
ncbi:MAG: hypothetical protein ABIJ30_12115 [bacterium]